MQLVLVNYSHRTLFRSWEWILSTPSPAFRWGVIVLPFQTSAKPSGGFPREEVLPPPPSTWTVQSAGNPAVGSGFPCKA